jgi:heptosyltransferase-2
MKNTPFLNRPASENGNEQIARILLKPGAWHHRYSISALEAVLWLLLWFFKTPPVTGLGVNRVLVYELGALGDIVLLAPFLHRLRAHLPTARIVVAGRPGGGSLLFEQGLIDEWIPLDIPSSLSWLRLFRRAFGLRKRQFDLAFAVGWRGDFKGNLVIWLAGARRRVGYGYAGGGFLLTDVVPPDLSRPHVADRNMQLLDHLGLPPLRDGDILGVSPQDEEFAAELMAKHGIAREDLVIGVHPGAGSRAREWGVERFAEVARAAAEKFGAKILWFSDPVKPEPAPANLEAISLTLPLRQFAAVVYRCHVFVCNDSGPMHLAAALKVPVVAVFGPQRPEWFGPYGEGHRVVIRNDIWCRPCGDQCRWKEPYCMRLIPVEQVMHQVEDVLKNAASRSLRTAV